MTQGPYDPFHTGQPLPGPFVPPSQQPTANGDQTDDGLRDPALPYLGYLELVKALATTAVKNVFSSSYPTAQFQDLYASIEYPINQAEYPGIWIDYQDTGKLAIIGVDHKEWGDGLSLAPAPDPVTNTFQVPHTRWEFNGYLGFTVCALTSWERDRIYGELVRVISSRNAPIHLAFREQMENNPFVAVTLNLDEIEPQGNNAAPGTPWGTDELIYERTLNIELRGEFATDQVEGILLPLEVVTVNAEIDPAWVAQQTGI